jgi:hypothetical protein
MPGHNIPVLEIFNSMAAKNAVGSGVVLFVDLHRVREFSTEVNLFSAILFFAGGGAVRGGAASGAMEECRG